MKNKFCYDFDSAICSLEDQFGAYVFSDVCPLDSAVNVPVMGNNAPYTREMERRDRLYDDYANEKELRNNISDYKHQYIWASRRSIFLAHIEED